MKYAILFSLFLFACDEAGPPRGPVDLAKLDPGPGRVKSPYECKGPPEALATTGATPKAPAGPGMSFDAREERFAFWTADGQMTVRSARDGAVLWKGAGTAATLSDDGAQIAMFDAGAIVVRALPKGDEVLRAARTADALGLAWSDDGRPLVSVFESASPPAAVMYDVTAKKQCSTAWTGAFTPSDTFVVSPDRVRALVAEGSGLAIVYLVKGAREEKVAVAGRTDARYAFSRSGLVLAGAGSDGVYTWNTRSGKREAALSDAASSAVAINENGIYVAAVASGKVRVWDVRSSKLLREIAPQTGAPLGVLFFPAKNRVVIATDGGAEAVDIGNGASLWTAR